MRTWESLGLRAERIAASRSLNADAESWRGKVVGVNVWVTLYQSDRFHDRTDLWVNKTLTFYKGHLTPDDVARIVLEYVRDRMAVVGDLYEKWRGITADAERALGKEE